MTLAGALAPLREKLLAAIKSNTGRADKALERAIAALGAYGKEDDGEAQKKEAEAQKKKEDTAAVAVRMAVKGFVDGATLVLHDGTIPKFLMAVNITPRPQTLEELVDKLVPLGEGRAKTLVRAALDVCADKGEDRPAGERKGMAQMMKAVEGAKGALRTMGVKELTVRESEAIGELVTAVSAFYQQHGTPGDGDVRVTHKMTVGNLASLATALPRAVTGRYPPSTSVGVLMCDADLQQLLPGDPLRGSITTILRLDDMLGGLQGTLVSTVAQKYVLDMMARGLSPAVTLAAWQGGLSGGAAAAAAALPADADGGNALMAKLLREVRAFEGAGRHSLSLGGGAGTLDEGVQAVLARPLLEAVAAMVADAAAFTHQGQTRSDSHGAPRSGRPRGVTTAAPYPFMLWKAMCFLAAGTAVFALSEQVANAVGGAGLLVYVPTTNLATAIKRGREEDTSDEEGGAGGAASQQPKTGKGKKEREKKARQKERKKARGEGGAQPAAAARGMASDSSEGEGAHGGAGGAAAASGAVAPRDGFPLWDFLTRSPGQAKYRRRDCGMRCCYCGSKECSYGAACPAGFPKARLQAKGEKYDPQFKTRAELAQMYAAMKEKHQRR